jgi:hypothetical protein
MPPLAPLLATLALVAVAKHQAGHNTYQFTSGQLNQNL